MIGSQARPAGWYPNPERTGEARYWDGQAWTGHVAQPSGPAWFSIPLPPEGRRAEVQIGLSAVPALAAAVIGFGAGAGLSFLIVLLLTVAGNPGGEPARLGLPS